MHRTPSGPRASDKPSVVWAPLLAVLFVSGDMAVVEGLRTVLGPVPQHLDDLLGALVGAGLCTLGHCLLPTARPGPLYAVIAAMARARHRALLRHRADRRRIRRDLHDGIGPVLAAVSMQAGLARRLVTDDPAAAAAMLEGFEESVGVALDDLRHTLRDLSAPELAEPDLDAALRARAADFGAGGLTVAVDLPEQLPPLPAQVTRTVDLITAEALSNSVRHGRARSCRIRVREVAGSLLAEIADDGVGLPPRYAPGLGMCSLHERAAALGGTARTVRSPEGGTKVLLSLPLVR